MTRTPSSSYAWSAPFLAVALLFAACGTQREHEYAQRWVEMADHSDDALRAVSAVSSGDLDAVKAAGKGLSRKDKVPQLPEHALPILASVRELGGELAKSPDLGSAATTLGALSVQCHACHSALDITMRPEPGEDPMQRAWLALLWRDREAWKATGLPGESWDERRRALEAALQPQPEAQGDAP